MIVRWKYCDTAISRGYPLLIAVSQYDKYISCGDDYVEK